MNGSAPISEVPRGTANLISFAALAKEEPDRLSDPVFFSTMVRGISVEMSNRTGAAHLGSVMSCADILGSYFSTLRDDDNVDFVLSNFVLSKGHAALGLYAGLFLLGKITTAELLSYCQAGSVFEEHPNHKVPAVSSPTGSLGHGLGFMVGRLVGFRSQNIEASGVVLMSDGECNEGSVWEAALFASAKSVGGLVAIVEANGFQATGRSTESYGAVKIEEMFSGFGWVGQRVDGHDHSALQQAVTGGLASEKPNFVVAETTKGQGVSFMEDDNNWHYRSPNEAEVNMALVELGLS